MYKVENYKGKQMVFEPHTNGKMSVFLPGLGAYGTDLQIFEPSEGDARTRAKVAIDRYVSREET